MISHYNLNSIELNRKNIYYYNYISIIKFYLNFFLNYIFFKKIVTFLLYMNIMDFFYILHCENKECIVFMIVFYLF